jgi:hypothetical protein
MAINEVNVKVLPDLIHCIADFYYFIFVNLQLLNLSGKVVEMKKYFCLLALSLFIAFTAIVNAQEKPVQVALFNPVQIFPENTSISGIRLNIIYGKNTNVTGLDLGLVNQTTGSQTGVQWGGVNMTGSFKGWQDGWVNITNGNSLGLQTALVNYHSGHFNGLQLSIVNYAATMKGLQLGLINIIGKGGFLPVFVLFNFDFD